MIFHRHKWNLLIKIGSQSLDKDNVYSIPEDIVFVCDCGKIKKVEVKKWKK